MINIYFLLSYCTTFSYEKDKKRNAESKGKKLFVCLISNVATVRREAFQELAPFKSRVLLLPCSKVPLTHSSMSLSVRIYERMLLAGTCCVQSKGVIFYRQFERLLIPSYYTTRKVPYSYLYSKGLVCC